MIKAYSIKKSSEEFSNDAPYEGYVDVVIYEGGVRYRAIGIGWDKSDKDANGEFTKEFLREAYKWASVWEQ